MIDIGEAVRRTVTHRIADARIVPRLYAAVAPPVEAMPDVASVVERGLQFE